MLFNSSENIGKCAFCCTAAPKSLKRDIADFPGISVALCSEEACSLAVGELFGDDEPALVEGVMDARPHPVPYVWSSDHFVNLIAILYNKVAGQYDPAQPVAQLEQHSGGLSEEVRLVHAEVQRLLVGRASFDREAMLEFCDEGRLKVSSADGIRVDHKEAKQPKMLTTKDGLVYSVEALAIQFCALYEKWLKSRQRKFMPNFRTALFWGKITTMYWRLAISLGWSGQVASNLMLVIFTWREPSTPTLLTTTQLPVVAVPPAVAAANAVAMAAATPAAPVVAVVEAVPPPPVQKRFLDPITTPTAPVLPPPRVVQSPSPTAVAAAAAPARMATPTTSLMDIPPPPQALSSPAPTAPAEPLADGSSTTTVVVTTTTTTTKTSESTADEPESASVTEDEEGSGESEAAEAEPGDDDTSADGGDAGSDDADPEAEEAAATVDASLGSLLGRAKTGVSNTASNLKYGRVASSLKSTGNRLANNEVNTQRVINELERWFINFACARATKDLREDMTVGDAMVAMVNTLWFLGLRHEDLVRSRDGATFKAFLLVLIDETNNSDNLASTPKQQRQLSDQQRASLCARNTKSADFIYIARFLLKACNDFVNGGLGTRNKSTAGPSTNEQYRARVKSEWRSVMNTLAARLGSDARWFLERILRGVAMLTVNRSCPSALSWQIMNDTRSPIGRSNQCDVARDLNARQQEQSEVSGDGDNELAFSELFVASLIAAPAAATSPMPSSFLLVAPRGNVPVAPASALIDESYPDDKYAQDDFDMDDDAVDIDQDVNASLVGLSLFSPKQRGLDNVSGITNEDAKQLLKAFDPRGRSGTRRDVRFLYEAMVPAGTLYSPAKNYGPDAVRPKYSRFAYFLKGELEKQLLMRLGRVVSASRQPSSMVDFDQATGILKRMFAVDQEAALRGTTAHSQVTYTQAQILARQIDPKNGKRLYGRIHIMELLLFHLTQTAELGGYLQQGQQPVVAVLPAPRMFPQVNTTYPTAALHVGSQAGEFDFEAVILAAAAASPLAERIASSLGSASTAVEPAYAGDVAQSAKVAAGFAAMFGKVPV